MQEASAKGEVSVAYQGNPGAYSESAVLAAFPDGHPVPCEQFEDAFQALSQFLVDRAVLPVENSLGGSIHAVYDLLIKCATPPPHVHSTVLCSKVTWCGDAQRF